MSLVSLLVAGLAAVRLTRLIGEDKITAGLRARFFARFNPIPQTAPAKKPKGRRWEAVRGQHDDDILGWSRDASRFGAWVADLLGCPYWCLSVWTGAAVVALLHLGEVGRAVVLLLALSQTTAITYSVAVPMSPRRRG